MSRPTIDEFDSMITTMISDEPPTSCFDCEFFFSMPPPHDGVLGCCIKANVHVDHRQVICTWRKLVGVRMLAERAEQLVPCWLYGIKRWCMGNGSSIEQLARGFLAKSTNIKCPGGGVSDEDFTAGR